MLIWQDKCKGKGKGKVRSYKKLNIKVQSQILQYSTSNATQTEYRQKNK